MTNKNFSFSLVIVYKICTFAIDFCINHRIKTYEKHRT